MKKVPAPPAPELAFWNHWPRRISCYTAAPIRQMFWRSKLGLNMRAIGDGRIGFISPSRLLFGLRLAGRAPGIFLRQAGQTNVAATMSFLLAEASHEDYVYTRPCYARFSHALYDPRPPPTSCKRSHRPWLSDGLVGGLLASPCNSGSQMDSEPRPLVCLHVRHSTPLLLLMTHQYLRLAREVPACYLRVPQGRCHSPEAAESEYVSIQHASNIPQPPTQWQRPSFTYITQMFRYKIPDHGEKACGRLHATAKITYSLHITPHADQHCQANCSTSPSSQQHRTRHDWARHVRS